MVITLLASCVLLGFIVADGILEWQRLFRLIKGVSVADLPVPLSWKVMLPCYVAGIVFAIVGARQAGL